jgi:hypothetical protein
MRLNGFGVTNRTTLKCFITIIYQTQSLIGDHFTKPWDEMILLFIDISNNELSYYKAFTLVLFLMLKHIKGEEEITINGIYTICLNVSSIPDDLPYKCNGMYYYIHDLISIYNKEIE